jgi:hypothetical protein
MVAIIIEAPPGRDVLIGTRVGYAVAAIERAHFGTTAA